MGEFIAGFLAFSLIIIAMVLGVIYGKLRLHGSCGGEIYTSVPWRNSFPLPVPIPPGPRRGAPSPYLRIRLGYTPCGPGGSTPALREITYATGH